MSITDFCNETIRPGVIYVRRNREGVDFDEWYAMVSKANTESVTFSKQKGGKFTMPAEQFKQEYTA